MVQGSSEKKSLHSEDGCYRGYQTVSSIYDFAAVLSPSYVSAAFITDFQKLTSNLFDGIIEVFFLPPLWTQLAASKKNLN